MELTDKDKKISKTIGLHKHCCAVCGKVFESRIDYVYKKYTSKSKGTDYYCSYTCMRKAEKDDIRK